MSKDYLSEEEYLPDEATIDQEPDLNLVPIVAIKSGKDEGKVVIVEGNRFVMGRTKACNLMLRDKSVSRKHAEITINPDGKSKIKDLDSRWGTRINGEKIAESVLKYGDEFEIAGVLFKYDIARRKEVEEMMKGNRSGARRLLLIGFIVISILAAGTLYYFKGSVRQNLDRPGADVLSKIMYHYDQGIKYYNELDTTDPGVKSKVIEEMEQVIELDPEGNTRFSRSARRIIDGLE